MLYYRWMIFFFIYNLERERILWKYSELARYSNTTGFNYTVWIERKVSPKLLFLNSPKFFRFYLYLSPSSLWRTNISWRGEVIRLHDDFNYKYKINVKQVLLLAGATWVDDDGWALIKKSNNYWRRASAPSQPILCVAERKLEGQLSLQCEID